MTGKKGMIMSEELVSLRSRYLIPNFFELLAPLEGETLKSHCEGYVCLNEWMFKAGIRIPLERRSLASGGERGGWRGRREAE
ncbi:hypothetical protein ACLOJK_005625 [Asimina triloba]